MAISKIKGQQLNILENDRNDRYYRKEIRRQDRNHEQQQSRNYKYSYERENNFRCKLQNTQNKPQFQPRYPNESTRYFYNNQRIQNTYSQTRGNNEFQQDKVQL